MRGQGTSLKQRMSIHGVAWLASEPGWLAKALASSAILNFFQRIISCHWGRSRIEAFAKRYPERVRWIVFGAIAVVVASSHPSLRVAWLMLGVLTLCSVGMLKRIDPAHWDWLSRFFLWALAARVLVAIALYFLSPRVWIPTEAGLVQNGGFFIGDAYVYAFNGEWLAEYWKHGIFPTDQFLRTISMSKTICPYDFWVGLLVYWLGYHPMTPVLLNCLFGAWSGVLLYWIAQLYLPERNARLAGWLGAYWPSLFLWSTQNLKEPMSVFLLVAALYCFLVPARRIGWLLARLLGAGAVWGLKMLNPFIGPLFMASVVVSVILRLKFLRFCFLAVAGLSAVLLVTGQGDLLLPVTRKVDQLVFGRQVIELALTPRRFVQVVEYLRRVRMAESRTPFLEDVRFESPGHLVRFFPVAFAALLTMPMPWTARSLSECVGAVEMLLWYPLFIFALRGVVRAFKIDSGQVLLLVTALFICSAIALLEGNVGTLFRHRANVWPLLLFFVATGLYNPTRTVEVQYG